jgi:hypothetical protein
MLTTASLPDVEARRETAAVPWFIWCGVIAVTCASWGPHWDIAWHRSIGRDAFWTPPHVAIYFCGVLAGFASAWLILSTTFGKNAEARAAAVKMWGFRGPLGAFLAAWGCVAMLTSAPFDDWWHNAYGLDVKIISPPHALLALGIVIIEVGSLMLILGFMNRAEGALRRRLEWLFLYVGAMILVALTTFLLEEIDRTHMHRARFYALLALPVPLALVGLGWAVQSRWACTRVALLHALFYLATLWIFPLVPAEPKLGPVYFQTKFLVPAGFPLLLLVPAVGLDLLRQASDGWSRARVALAAGALFFVSFLVVQWPFATFLQSPAARNAIFGAHYFGYYTRPTWNEFLFRFEPTEPPLRFAITLVVGLTIAVAASRIGLSWGQMMQRIKR